MDIFVIKKIIGAAATPLGVVLLLMILSLFAAIRNNKNSNLLFSSLAFIALILFSTPFATNRMLSPIEQQYHQFDLSQPANTIVILGCGHSNDGTLPITAQLYGCSISRLNEGLRIHQANPGSSIITTGYGGNEPFSNAETGKQLLVALGVDEQQITAYGSPKDTVQEAKILAPLLGLKSFVLVTSASHMPRAIAIFKQQGMTPIAAPTGHLVKDESRDPWWKSLPHSDHLRKAERFGYETLGRLWLNVKDLLGLD